MTSDAKIGLLLGLVFIFIIAFVINGLPSLRPPTRADATITVMPEQDLVGVSGRADEAVGSWSEPFAPPTTSHDPAPVAVQTPPQVTPGLTAREPTPTPAPVPPPEGEGIRFSRSLENLLSHLTPVVPKDQVSTINVDVPRPAPEPPAVAERPPVTVASQSRPEPRSMEPPARVETQELPRPATVATVPSSVPGSKSYVVVEGDTMAAIAKKMYGPEEGNRIANIERIIQANQGILKSADMVIVGQKLVIPPPLPPQVKTSAVAPAPTSVGVPAPRKPTPAEVLPKAYFEKPKSSTESMTISEKVESLARRAPAAIPAPVPEGRWYTVQEGDNLWKIAASQLGVGSRWDELHKLNSDLLPSQDSLKVGMRLRLPAK